MPPKAKSAAPLIKGQGSLGGWFAGGKLTKAEQQEEQQQEGKGEAESGLSSTSAAAGQSPSGKRSGAKGKNGSVATGKDKKEGVPPEIKHVEEKVSD